MEITRIQNNQTMLIKKKKVGGLIVILRLILMLQKLSSQIDQWNRIEHQEIGRHTYQLIFNKSTKLF